MELSLHFIFLTLALISNTPNVMGRISELTPVACSQAGAVLYNGYCYQAFKDRALTWNEAQLACNIWGGDLATIDSEALAFAVVPSGYSLSFWIGMKVIDGNFIWVYDNSAVDLASPELNNWADFGAHKPGFDCQSLIDEGYGFYLQEKLCSSTSYYVCMGVPTSAIETTITTTTTTTVKTTLSSKSTKTHSDYSKISKDKSKKIPKGANGEKGNDNKEKHD